jgi:WD40 repeat protein
METNLTHQCEGHSQNVTTVRINQDNKWFLTGSKDGTLRRWDLATGEALGATFDMTTAGDDPSGILSSAICPTGEWFLCSEESGFVSKWDVASGKCVKRVTIPRDKHTHTGNSTPVTVQHMSTFFPSVVQQITHTAGHKPVAICGCSDHSLKVLDANTGDIVQSCVAHKSMILCTSFVAHSDHKVISGGVDGEVCLWDMHHAETPLATFADNEAAVSCCAPLGKKCFLTGGHDRTIRLFDLSSRQNVHTFAACAGHAHITSVATMPGDDYALSSSNDETDTSIRIWDLRMGKMLQQVQHPGALDNLAVGRYGKRLVTGSQDGMVNIWGITNNTRLCTVQ